MKKTQQSATGKIQLITMKEVLESLQVSRTKVYMMVDQGIFPKPLKLGKSIRWKLSDIEAFMEAANDE